MCVDDPTTPKPPLVHKKPLVRYGKKPKLPPALLEEGVIADYCTINKDAKEFVGQIQSNPIAIVQPPLAVKEEVNLDVHVVESPPKCTII